MCKVDGRRPGQVAAAFYRVSERLGICTEPLLPTETPRVGQIDEPFIARWSRRCARWMAGDLARSPRLSTECQRETRYLYRAVTAYRDAAYRDVPRVLNMCTFSLQVGDTFLARWVKNLQGGWPVTWPGRCGGLPSVGDTFVILPSSRRLPKRSLPRCPVCAKNMHLLLQSVLLICTVDGRCPPYFFKLPDRGSCLLKVSLSSQEETQC